MGPADKYRRFSGKSIARKLPLESTYQGMLASLGPRTRRSLQGKRQQLEKSANVVFCPALDPEAAITAMLELQPKVVAPPHRKVLPGAPGPAPRAPGILLHGDAPARRPLAQHPERLAPGWSHLHRFPDERSALQKRVALGGLCAPSCSSTKSASRQQLINFVGGTSLLLRRYCQPLELCTDAYLWRPSLRATVLKMVAPRLRPGGLHERARAGADTSPPETLSESD